MSVWAKLLDEPLSALSHYSECCVKFVSLSWVLLERYNYTESLDIPKFTACCQTSFSPHTHTQKRVVIAYCGSTTKKQHSALLQLFEDYEKVLKPGQKPKKGIELANAKINNVSTGSPSGSQNNSPAYTPTLANSSPSPSPSPRNSITLSTSPNVQSLGTQGTALHSFQIATPNETHEFRTDSENDRLRWMKLLGLLVMFPYSTIPEEPQNNPIKESFRCKLDPTQYGAGMLTAWKKQVYYFTFLDYGVVTACDNNIRTKLITFLSLLVVELKAC